MADGIDIITRLALPATNILGHLLAGNFDKEKPSECRPYPFANIVKSRVKYDETRV